MSHLLRIADNGEQGASGVRDGGRRGTRRQRRGGFRATCARDRFSATACFILLSCGNDPWYTILRLGYGAEAAAALEVRNSADSCGPFVDIFPQKCEDTAKPRVSSQARLSREGIFVLGGRQQRKRLFFTRPWFL